ncbi:DUF2815 family protein [uncultured Oscillibacter sp.]|uniref:DUF2815 family protein n=1 Tax=uncultured Oscillibacter sp. TaxID=876091 RepID=UPI0025E5B685|nr:DUF2815 family protein [uncultured Oscillibacter sp.]
MNANTLTIGEARLSYCNLFQPKPPFNNPQGDPKYSTTVLVPKTNLAAKAAIDSAINAAISTGISSKWDGKKPAMLAICVHDGDGPRPSDGEPFGPECKGCWVFTASCKPDRPPFVVDANVQPILQQSEIYSGVFGNVNISFFPYNNGGKKGIGCGLNGFQKARDGEPLGNSVSAAEAFGATAAMPATPGYAVPGYAPAPAPVPAPAYTPPVAAPAYPQQPPVAYPPQQTAPVYPQQWPVDPITGQPVPNGMPVMGM